MVNLLYSENEKGDCSVQKMKNGFAINFKIINLLGIGLLGLMTIVASGGGGGGGSGDTPATPPESVKYGAFIDSAVSVSYTHLRAHETT